MFTTLKTTAIAAGFAFAALSTAPAAHAGDIRAVEIQTLVQYSSTSIQGLNIAYREAGDPANPTIVLLHGFPTSSHMFRDLIPLIAEKWHVIAPDYPGFGASDMPLAEDFEYSFDNFSDIVLELLAQKNVDEYAAYVMDYGAPVGYRMFAKAPERVTGFVIQNGNAYEEGLEEFWDPIRAYWADRSEENAAPLRAFLSLEGTKWQYQTGMQNPDRVSADNYWHVQYLLDRPGNQEVQLELFYDYGTNLAEYPKWQALFREYQPQALLMWGANDPIFPESGAHPYKRDLENLEFHILDTGHFALEEFAYDIATRMNAFADRVAQHSN